MPLEGSIVRQHLNINFVQSIAPIFDIGFRTTLSFVFIPNGQIDQYLVNPDDEGHVLMTFSPTEIDDILEAGTFAFKQAKARYRYAAPEGHMIFPYELPANPTDTDITEAFQALFDYVETNPGVGWPYLQFTNLNNIDVPELQDNTFLSAASDFIGSNEALICLRQEREYDNRSMAQQAKIKAESLNSERTALAVHNGDDTDLDGIADSEAELDALAFGFIGSLPVSGWEIFMKDVKGLRSADFTTTERLILENGWPGNSAGFTATDAFQEPSFSANQSTGGNFLDIIQVQDFLKFNWRQSYTLRQKNLNKIPYTFNGKQIIGNLFEEVLLANVEDKVTNVGIVRLLEDGSPDYNIFLPDIEDIPLADRVNRVFSGVRTDFGYTGSIIDVSNDVVIRV